MKCGDVNLRQLSRSVTVDFMEKATRLFKLYYGVANLSMHFLSTYFKLHTSTKNYTLQFLIGHVIHTNFNKP